MSFSSYAVDPDVPIHSVVDTYSQSSGRTMTPPPAPHHSSLDNSSLSTVASSDPTPRLSDGPTEALQLMLAEERRKLFRVMNECDAARSVSAELKKRIQHLEGLAQDRERAVELKQRQLAESSAKCVDLEAQVENIAAEAHRIVGQWHAELERSQFECSRAVERATRLEDELAVERSMHATVKEAHRRAMEEAATAKSNAEAMLRDRATAQISVSDAVAEKDRLATRLRELETTYDSLRHKYSATAEELSSAKSEAQRYASAAAEAAAETVRWKTDCLDAFNLAQQQRTLLAAETAAAAQAEAKAREYANCVESLQSVTKQTREALSTVDAERQRLERLVEDLTTDKAELQATLVKAEHVAKSYAAAAKDQQAEFTLLSSQLDDKINALTTERDALASDKAELTRDIAGLQAAVMELSEITTDADARVTAAEEQAHKAAQELVAATASWSVEREALVAESASVKETLRRSEIDVQELRAEIVALSAKVTAESTHGLQLQTALDAQLAAAKQALQDKSSEASQSASRATALAAQLEALHMELSSASATRQSLEEQLESCHKELASLRLEVESEKAMRHADLQRFNAAAADTARRAAEEVAESHSRHAAEVQQFKQHIVTLTADLNKALQHTAELETKVQQSVAEVTSERSVRAQSVAEYERRYAEEMEASSARYAAAQAEVMQLKQEVDKLLRGHRELSDELDRVSEEYRIVHGERNSAMERVSATERLLRQLESQREELDSRLRETTAERDTLDARVKQLRSDLSKANATARDDLVQARQAHMDELAQVKSMLTGAQSTVEHSKKSIADARAERDAARQRVAELTAANTELNRSLASAEQKGNELLKQKNDAKAALAEWRTAAERQRAVGEELRAERDEMIADRDRIAAKYNALYEEKSSALGSSWKAQQEAQAKADTYLRQATELRNALAEQTTLAARNQRTLQSLAEANEALKASLSEALRRGGEHHGSSGSAILSRTEVPLNVAEGPRRHPKKRSASAASHNSTMEQANHTPAAPIPFEQQPPRSQPAAAPPSRSESVGSNASAPRGRPMTALAPTDSNSQQHLKASTTATGPATHVTMPTTHSIIL